MTYHLIPTILYSGEGKTKERVKRPVAARDWRVGEGMNRQNIEDFQGRKQPEWYHNDELMLLYICPKHRMYNIISKVNHSMNYELWATMRWQGRFISCNKYPIWWVMLATGRLCMATYMIGTGESVSAPQICRDLKLLYKNKALGFPWWYSVLPMQGAQIWSLVRELDPSCCN